MRKLTIALCLLACQCAAGQDLMARNMQLAARRAVATNPDVTRGLVSHWDMSNSGTTVYDVYGANNATAYGGVSFAATNGVSGNGARFANNADKVSAARFSGTGDFSFCAWVKYSALSTTFDVCLWNGNDSTTSGFGFSRKPSQRIVRASWGSYNGEVAGFALNDNEWYFLSSTYNGSSHSFYIDGKFQGSANYTVSNFISGTFNLSGILGSYFYFKGSIDEVRIYNVALTSNEVHTLYLHDAP